MKMNITKKRFFLPLVISAGAVALLLLGSLIPALWSASIARSFTDHQAAKRWNPEGYAQVSAFVRNGREISFDEAYSYNQTIDRKLRDASFSPSENGRLWYSAYSGESSLYAVTTRDTAQVTVTVYGGDFFLIHTPELISGSYPGTDGTSAGFILLDDNTAWKLFGALSIEGLSLTINGHDYIVCGVVKALKGSMWDEAYGSGYRAWMYCESQDAGAARVNCYEAVLPNPLENYAAHLLEELIPESKVVEYSSRFETANLIESLRSRSKAAARTKAYVYPWWENLALAAEYRCASLLNAELVLFVLAGLIVLVWIGIAWMPASRAIARVARAVWEGIPDRINTYRWNKTHNPSSEKVKSGRGMKKTEAGSEEKPSSDVPGTKE